MCPLSFWTAGALVFVKYFPNKRRNERRRAYFASIRAFSSWHATRKLSSSIG